MGWTLDQAMTSLKVPEAERQASIRICYKSSRKLNAGSQLCFPAFFLN